MFWGRIRMTDKCFFFVLLPFLLTAEKFVLHKGQKHYIRRMLTTQLAGFVRGLGRKRNSSSGRFYSEEIEGGFCIYLPSR